jgi:hypothetical protein
MAKLQFVIALPEYPEGTSPPAWRFAPLMIALEALCQIDEWQLAKTGPYPSLYSSGVVYQAEPEGQEDWCDIPTVLAQGWGDCEDLACWRVAEYRRMGIHAVPYIKWKHIPYAELVMLAQTGQWVPPPSGIPHDGIILIHVMVQLPDGSIECPSARLGMKGEYS